MRYWVAVLLLAACSGSGAATTSLETSTPPTVSSTSTITSPATPTSSTSAQSVSPAAIPSVLEVAEFPVTPGSGPHDVAPAPDGTVWYSGQANGTLGRLDPSTGAITEFPLGPGSAPHGVIVGPDGFPWLTDSGLNALVRVDPTNGEVSVFELPAANVNLNTAVFDSDGVLWFTGQAGWYGRLNPASGELEVFAAPRGRGPYGITVTPDNQVFYASLAGNHIALIDATEGNATLLEPPTPQQGARRVWSDSAAIVWVSEWEAGQVAAYDTAGGSWREWPLPGENPSAYAVYVDETDRVWLTDFSGNGAIVRFDPASETFDSYPLPSPGGNVRQLLGRPGEVWGAESAADALVVVRYGS